MYLVSYYEDGKKKTTYITGDPNEIRQNFIKKNRVVLSIKKVKYFGRLSSPSVMDMYASLKALADLLNSGVRLTDAISTVINVIPSLPMKRILAIMLDTVMEGREVTQGMPSSVFGSTVVAVIRAGEKTGRLAEAFDVAAEHLKKLSEIKKETLKKISYPLVVLLIGVVSLFLNTTIIIPKILNSDLFQVISKESAEVPIYTLKVLSFAMPALIIFSLLSMSGLFILYKKDPERAERFLIKVPYLREFLFYRSFFIAFYSFGKLLESGERLDVSLEIACSSIEFYTVRKEFERAKQKFKEGEHFASGFKYITVIEKTMLESASSMDKVQKTVELISKRFYEKYNEKLKGLTPKIYAFVLFFASIVLILFALAIIIPYGKILGGLHA
ncbi:MAG: type II secretion system F family protein [Candidatus Omnitrophica bacterium]|nr:type II secretion system F family protein [Candidatus Omnitrophota bacterium]